VAEQLQGLIGSQQQLLSDVFHEPRSPMARQREEDQANPDLDRIECKADRLNELIGQLLSLARLESDDERCGSAFFRRGA
jgi:two-component system sensor histidine kinase CpxA